MCLEFSRRHMPKGFEQAPVVVPVHPLEGRVFHSLVATPRPAPAEAVSSGSGPTRSRRCDARMTVYSYPPPAMVPDCMVSGAGLASSLPPRLRFGLPAVTVAILGAMSLAFAVHGLGVVRRQRIRVETDEDRLWFSPRHVARASRESRA